MAGPRKEDRSNLVWQSQLPSQRQAKEGIAMKKVHVVQPPSKTRETVVKQYIRAVRGLSVTFFVLSVCLAAAGALAQQLGRESVQGGFGSQESNLASLDPGPRAGSVGSGNPIQGLTLQQATFFQNGLSQFNELEGVPRLSPGNGGPCPSLKNHPSRSFPPPELLF